MVSRQVLCNIKATLDSTIGPTVKPCPRFEAAWHAGQEGMYAGESAFIAQACWYEYGAEVKPIGSINVVADLVM